jgi:hypothetical protein
MVCAICCIASNIYLASYDQCPAVAVSSCDQCAPVTLLTQGGSVAPRSWEILQIYTKVGKCGHSGYFTPLLKSKIGFPNFSQFSQGHIGIAIYPNRVILRYFLVNHGMVKTDQGLRRVLVVVQLCYHQVQRSYYGTYVLVGLLRSFYDYVSFASQ